MFRMTKLMAAIAVLLLVAPFSYAGGKKDQNPAPASQTGSTTTQTTVSPAQSAPSNPYFTGDGGKGRSITILPPRGVGLATNQAYLPDFVANELLSNFSSFSAMTPFDRVNNQRQYDELLSGYYADNDKAGLDLGHLASTDYMLLGNITRTSTGYALQLTVNSNSDKTTVAAYSGTVSVAELDNLTGVRRASLDLLGKMGVQVTAQGRTELTRAATAERVNAQTAMAQGIVAQRGGTVVEALSSFIQASNYDPSLAEAASRLNTLSTNISSGNIGENVRNDIQWRNEWVKILTEAEDFFTKHSPYEIIYHTNFTQGKINYQSETTDLSFTVEVVPTNAFQIVNDILKGLKVTGKKSEWGMRSWPLSSRVFADYKRPYPHADDVAKRISVAFRLKNDNEKIIGTTTVNLENDINFRTFRKGHYWTVGDDEQRYWDDTIVAQGAERIAVFQQVNANDITDKLVIEVVSVNGVDVAKNPDYIRITAK